MRTLLLAAVSVLSVAGCSWLEPQASDFSALAVLKEPPNCTANMNARRSLGQFATLGRRYPEAFKTYLDREDLIDARRSCGEITRAEWEVEADAALSSYLAYERQMDEAKSKAALLKRTDSPPQIHRTETRVDPLSEPAI